MTKKKKIVAVIILLHISIACFPQSNQTYSIQQLNGIWKNSEDTSIIKIFNNGNYLNLAYDKKQFWIIERGYYGFCNQDKEPDDIKKSDLMSKSTEEANFCLIGKAGSVLSYEFEYECDKICSLLLFGQNVFKYEKIAISPLLADKLYQQAKIDQKNYLQDYLGIEMREVAVNKSTIYQSPNVTTKMYLIKGDLVSVLEQKGDWVKIEYQGKKKVQGWLKKGDIK